MSFNLTYILSLLLTALIPFMLSGCGCCCNHKHMPSPPEGHLVDGTRLAELEEQQEAIDSSGKERLGKMILEMDGPVGNRKSRTYSYKVSEGLEDEDDNLMVVKNDKKMLHV